MTISSTQTDRPVSVTESTPLLNPVSAYSTHRLCSVHAPDLATALVLHLDRPSDLLTSASLNEHDSSAEPFGLDIALESPSSFRRTRLVLLDVFRGLVLCLQLIDTATEFLCRSSSKYSQSWHQLIHFPLPHSTFIIHLVTLICTPSLHFLLGCGAVLAINTRRSLGWGSIGLVWRSLKLGLILLVLNQLLMSQKLIQARGHVLLIMLPIWSLGFNLFLITLLLVGLFQIQRVLIIRLLKNHPLTQSEPPPKFDQLLADLGPSPAFVNLVIDTCLVLIGLGLPLVIGYMLPGSRDAPDQDWWIDWAQTRSWWFWFLVTPTPDMSSNPRSYLVSSYAPIGWFPYVILGAAYGRTLIRKRRTKSGHFVHHLKLAFYACVIFLLTRLLDIGNHSSPDLIVKSSFSFLRGNWQMALFTTEFPPDLAHLSLALTLQFITLAILDLFPPRLLESTPLLQFGRSPMIFYSAQLLSFHYLLPSILAILSWPSVLSIFWGSMVALACLPVFWLVCEAWVIFKDQYRPESVWRFL
ncbi:hypothetical protein CROQUDRAFT_663727 [Cronartium quercuum f. sp. fusiforme G11]|uniref:Uncharacterized protein n=1 Tax=Cronartium quercuum f. sp. fusiforme G11 TaxID=708437 RepID=A0A9P6NCI1_9BASI|nr:hypothetical protein CROQUDRAFT_663727 [Cronartium quercuum f. sp. fusiforme G11]